MKELKIVVHSLNDLEKTASQLISFAGERKIVAFYGAMGSGKTTFIKAICRQLGVKGAINSPTFALLNEYAGEDENPVYHFDFYRIKSQQEAIDIGCEEYFYSGHYCFVEWPEKILNLLPKEIVQVILEVPDVQHETRLITFRYE